MTREEHVETLKVKQNARVKYNQAKQAERDAEAQRIAARRADPTDYVPKHRYRTRLPKHLVGA